MFFPDLPLDPPVDHPCPKPDCGEDSPDPDCALCDGTGMAGEYSIDIYRGKNDERR